MSDLIKDDTYRVRRRLRAGGTGEVDAVFQGYGALYYEARVVDGRVPIFQDRSGGAPFSAIEVLDGPESH